MPLRYGLSLLGIVSRHYKFMLTGCELSVHKLMDGHLLFSTARYQHLICTYDTLLLEGGRYRLKIFENAVQGSLSEGDSSESQMLLVLVPWQAPSKAKEAKKLQTIA